MNQLQKQLKLKSEEGLNLLAYAGVVKRRYKIALAVFSLFFLAVAAYTLQSWPVYRLSSTLYVRPEQTAFNPLEELGFGESSTVESEILLLKSRTNVEEVVRRMRLDWAVNRRPRNVTAKISDFKLPASEDEREFEITLLGGGTFEVKKGRTVLGTGSVGAPFVSGPLSLTFSALEGPAGSSFHLVNYPFYKIVEYVREAVGAAEAGKKTNFIELTYLDGDPERGKDIVNELVNVYIGRTVDFKTQEAAQSLEFIEKQLEDVRKALDAAEEDLENFRARSEVVSLTDEGRLIVEALTEADKERAKIAFKRRQLEIAVEDLKASRAEKRSHIPAVITDPLMADLSARLTELEAKRELLLSDSTEEHPMVRQVESQISELRERLSSVYGEALKQAVREENSIADRMRDYETRLKKLPEAERTFARLTRLSKVNSDIYMFLMEKHENARILKASTISNIKIIDPAIVPDKPLRPNKPRNLAFGFIGGILLGILAAFLMDHFDNAVKSPEQATEAAGTPLLTAVPYMGKRRRRELKEEVTGLSEALIGFHSPKSSIAEAYRRLRTALRYSRTGPSPQVFLFTSSLPGEGKSTTAANFALILAHTGSKVVLMDCDLRRPVVETFFNIPKTPGVTEVLTGEVKAEDAVKKTVIEGLSVLPCGVIPPIPSELIGSGEMASLISELRTRYDYVVIDTPPVLPASDAQLLAEHADSVILVATSGKTPADALAHAADRLRESGAHISGLVFNGYKGGEGYYGYTKYYGEDKESGSGKKKKGK